MVEAPAPMVVERRRRYVRGLPVQGRFQGAPVQWLSLVTSFYGIRGAGLPREAGLCTRVSCARFLACGALKRCIPGAALRPRWNEAARESETVGARAGERCFGSARLGNREHCSSVRQENPSKPDLRSARRRARRTAHLCTIVKVQYPRSRYLHNVGSCSHRFEPQRPLCPHTARLPNRSATP